MTEESKERVQEQAEQEQPQLSEEEIANMSYEDYLKLTHPGAPDGEIQKMLRKERRYTWMGRIQLLLLLLIVIVVIYFIVTK